MVKTRLIAVLLAGLILTVAGQARSETGKTFSPFEILSKRLYASIGPVIFRRSAPAGGTLVGANPGGGTPSFITGKNYDFGFEPGFDAALGLRVLDTTSVEIRALNFDTETGDTTVTPGGFIGAGFTGPAGTTFRSEYRTKLRSREINVRHNLFSDRFCVLGGIRRINLADNLGFNLNNGVAVGNYAYNNQLTGPQIGASVSLLPRTSRFQVQVTGKAGRYFGGTKGGIAEYAPAGNPIGGFATAEDSSVTGLEGSITAKYQINDGVTAFAAFEILSLGEQGLASNNASASLTNPALLNGNVFRDDLVFKGLKVGVKVNF